MAEQVGGGLTASTQTRPPQLTRRQWEVLRLVAIGYTNRQIARRISVAEGTVRKHLQNIFEQLHVTSRTAAVTSAFQPTWRLDAAPATTLGRSQPVDRAPAGTGGHHPSPVVVSDATRPGSRPSH